MATAAAATRASATQALTGCDVREVKEANELIRRMCTLLHIAYAAGSEFLIENPIDRGDPSRKVAYFNAQHGPLWLMPEIVTLSNVADCSSVHFSQCRFGKASQKDTTFLHTQGLTPMLAPLHELTCNHKPGEHH